MPENKDPNIHDKTRDQQQAMKEKTRLVEQQRQSRVNQQEPVGKLDQHPQRKQG